jgi:hypothetical protein
MFSVCSILRQTAEFHPTGYPFCFFKKTKIEKREWATTLSLQAENDGNETVGKPHYRRFRRRATAAKRGIGPG